MESELVAVDSKTENLVLAFLIAGLNVPPRRYFKFYNLTVPSTYVVDLFLSLSLELVKKIFCHLFQCEFSYKEQDCNVLSPKIFLHILARFEPMIFCMYCNYSSLT
jgi:hypothetical protein